MPDRVRPDLQAAWLVIRRDFFPGWDRAGRWWLEVGTHAPGTFAQCNRNSKVISVGDNVSRPNALDVILIHEICHAVTEGRHGVLWLRRMRKAAARAAELGRARLERSLTQEAGGYELFRPTAKGVYEDITREAAARPGRCFHDICEAVAKRYRLLGGELAVLYPYSQAVFDDAVWRGLTGEGTPKEFRHSSGRGNGDSRKP